MTRTVAITGISGGIGSATAAAFRAAGWTVIGVDVVEPPMGTGLDAFRALDLSSTNAQDQMSGFLEEHRGLDSLVCAAGLQSTATILEAGVSDWDGVMNVNARGTFLAMKAAHPMLHASRGAVVNVASVHALATSDRAGPYAASKAALVAITRSAALEWAPEVRVNAVLPGAIDTPMLTEGLARRPAAPSDRSTMDHVVDRTPLRRIGLPSEIAQAILFLADGDRSSFITGQTLIADGGALARLSTE